MREIGGLNGQKPYKEIPPSSRIRQKPITLFPLKFDEVISGMLKVKPERKPKKEAK